MTPRQSGSETDLELSDISSISLTTAMSVELRMELSSSMPSITSASCDFFSGATSSGAAFLSRRAWPVTVLVHPESNPESNTVIATANPTADVRATVPMGIAAPCFIGPL